jgi:hypothetical protein
MKNKKISLLLFATQIIAWGAITNWTFKSLLPNMTISIFGLCILTSSFLLPVAMRWIQNISDRGVSKCESNLKPITNNLLRFSVSLERQSFKMLPIVPILGILTFWFVAILN